MTLLYDDTHQSQAMALHGARKQAQAGAERSQDDADRRNGALMRRDPRLVRLLRAFSALADDQREAFVDRAIEAAGYLKQPIACIAVSAVLMAVAAVPTAAAMAATIVQRAERCDASAARLEISAASFDAAAESRAAFAISSIASADRFACSACATADSAIRGSGDVYLPILSFEKVCDLT